MNICSALVFADPKRACEVIASLTALDGVEVHQASPEGRIVVTLEDTSNSCAIDALRQIATLSGVIATSLIYHHFEPDLPRAGCSMELSQ